MVQVRPALHRALASGALVGCLWSSGLGCKESKSLAGAASRDEQAPAIIGPLVLDWSENYKLSVRGSKAEGTFFLTRDADKPPLRLQASFHDFPKGTKIRIGEEQHTLGEEGYWSTLIDVKPAIARQTLDDLKATVDLGQELSIEVPGSPRATTKLPKQNVKDGLRVALGKARDGGLNLGPSDVASTKPRAAAVLAAYDLDFVGAARTLAEVDWVAIAEDVKQPRSVKTCQFKQGPSQVKLIDAQVTIVERRSGKKVAEKVLPAKDECPMFAFVDKQDNSAKNIVGSGDVATWVRSELDRAAK